MTDFERKVLKAMDPSVANTVPQDLANMLIGKGLSVYQAEALLERAKGLLKAAII